MLGRYTGNERCMLLATWVLMGVNKTGVDALRLKVQESNVSLIDTDEPQH